MAKSSYIQTNGSRMARIVSGPGGGLVERVTSWLASKVCQPTYVCARVMPLPGWGRLRTKFLPGSRGGKEETSSLHGGWRWWRYLPFADSYVLQGNYCLEKSTHPAKNTNLNPSKKSEERRRKLSRIFNLLSVAKSAKKQRRFRAVFQGLSLDGRT